MPVRTEISRRHALLMAAGSLSLSAAPLDQARAQSAETAETAVRDIAPGAPGWQRFMVGDIAVVPVLDGVRPGDGPYPTFGENQSAEAVGDLMAANGLPRDKFVNFFHPTFLEIGDQLILVDTGMGEGGRGNGMGLLRQRMMSAGYDPEDVDIVVLTHLHGDHIGGLMEGGDPAFPNARYVVGSKEMEFWTSDAAKNGPAAQNAAMVEKLVVPFRDNTTLIEDGDEVVPGMTARAAFGHTPGMFVFKLASNGRTAYLMADTFGQFVVSLQRPQWHVRFDMDKEQAAKTREEFAAELAETGFPIVGYHLPFPAFGYVAKDGDSYRFVPESYQTLL